jgi:tRNA1(Val) A37 N6-methylase TrmN6
MSEALAAPGAEIVGAGTSADFTDDAFLGGRIVVRQSRRGYRAGIDSVLLSASTPEAFSGRLLDAGSGVGTVGLCVAARCSGADVALVERQPELLAFARWNIEANGFTPRVRAALADVTDFAETDDLRAGSFDRLLANPPFHDEGRGTPAPDASKAASHAMGVDDLASWVRFLARMAAPGAVASVIHKAQALPSLLTAFEGRFGALRLLPIHSRAEAPALRVIVSGVKGSRAPLQMAPPFILHMPDGAFTPAAQAIFRDGAAL